MKGPVRDPARVRAMFDSISGRYDLANRLMSLGRDSAWREQAAGETGASSADAVLDCACGSGSLCIALRRRGVGHVVGLDFSPGMLELARRRVPGVEFVEGDATSLPYEDDSFAAVTIGFGLRNLPDPHAGLREMARVVRPGGSLVVLEAVRPTGPLAPLLNAWVTGVIPRLGGFISGDRAAYAYLGATVSTYATAAELGSWLQQAGLTGIHVRRLMFGTVALARGIKPAP
jgi:demethylmenaquinone methyltransferase/2-methoxy-6-polyprenyl-1,4-benzoquinol methylase